MEEQTVETQETLEQKRERGLNLLLAQHGYEEDDILFRADMQDLSQDSKVRLFIPYPEKRSYDVYLRGIINYGQIKTLGEKYLGKSYSVRGPISHLSVGHDEIHMEFIRGNKLFTVHFYFEREIK